MMDNKKGRWNKWLLLDTMTERLSVWIHHCKLQKRLESEL